MVSSGQPQDDKDSSLPIRNNTLTPSSTEMSSQQNDMPPHNNSITTTTTTTALGSSHENNPNDNNTSSSSTSTTKLVLTFLAFVLTGSLFTVSSKLQAIPMYNYPSFLNVWGCILFVPLCFLYIIPASLYNIIPSTQLTASKKPFFIMAIFDTLSYTMTTFASIYLPGPLLVLVPQASIPITMALSKFYLKSAYGLWQYVGAMVVLVGIGVVLEPVLTNRNGPEYVCVAMDVGEDCVVCQEYMTQNQCEGFSSSDHDDNDGLYFSAEPFSLDRDTRSTMASSSSSQVCQWVESTHETSETSTMVLWSFILLLSCIPASISSIYKEQKLNEIEWDSIYLNGWIALYQVPMSALLAIPGGLLSSPPVKPLDLPSHFGDGMKCFVGQGTIMEGCHPDLYCHYAMVTMCACNVLAFLFANLMVLLLKYSSANLMFMALTCIVPLGNLAFALPFMPDGVRVALHVSDLVGLVVIMMGIVSYRFGSVFCGGCGKKVVVEDEDEEGGRRRDIESSCDLNEPLLCIEELGMEVEVVDEDDGWS